MLSKSLFNRVLTTIARHRVSSSVQLVSAKRNVSTDIIFNNNQIMLDMALLKNYRRVPLANIDFLLTRIIGTNNAVSTATVSEYVSRLRPFSVPPQPITTPTKVVEEFEMTSVLRKRRLKMNKHKHKKLRKRTRALRKKLGK